MVRRILTVLLLAFTGFNVLWLVADLAGIRDSEDKSQETVTAEGTGNTATAGTTTAMDQEQLPAQPALPAQPTSDQLAQPAMLGGGANHSPLDERIILTYFHGDYRCKECRLAERVAREVADEFYREEQTAGRLQWQTLNTDRPHNKHFLTKYSLVSQALVISAWLGEVEVRWKDLSGVWTLTKDENALKEYILAEIQEFMNNDDE